MMFQNENNLVLLLQEHNYFLYGPSLEQSLSLARCLIYARALLAHPYNM